jgi:hypothetical protein
MSHTRQSPKQIHADTRMITNKAEGTPLTGLFTINNVG